MSSDQNNITKVNFSNDLGSKIYSIAPDGNLIDSLTITIDSLQYLATTSTEQIIGVASDSVISFDELGNVDQMLVFENKVRAQKLFQDTLYILTENTIHLRSENLEFIQDYTYPEFGMFMDLKKINNTRCAVRKLAHF